MARNFGISVHQISEVTDGSGVILVVNIRKNMFLPTAVRPFLSHLKNARKQCFLYLHCKKRPGFVQPKRWWYLFQQKMFQKNNSASFQFFDDVSVSANRVDFCWKIFCWRLECQTWGFQLSNCIFFRNPRKAGILLPRQTNTTEMVYHDKSHLQKEKKEGRTSSNLHFLKVPEVFLQVDFYEIAGLLQVLVVWNAPPMIVNGFCNIQGDGNSISCSALPLCKSVKTFWCTCINSILFERGRERM